VPSGAWADIGEMVRERSVGHLNNAIRRLSGTGPVVDNPASNRNRRYVSKIA
jgi:hypothetical protein